METREREPVIRSSEKSKRARRGLIGSAALCAMLGALALSAASAFATLPLRSYDSQITGFGAPESVSIDGNDEVWISDVVSGSLISHYDAYPSQTKLGEQSGGGRWGGGNTVHGASFNVINGFLYAPVPGGQSHYNIFDNFGDWYGQMQEPENSISYFSGLETAVDDSNGLSAGRVYLYNGVGPNGYNAVIEAFDGYGNPVNFSGSASYIAGNKISGTPTGLFPYGAAGAGVNGRYGGITVDSDGNVWVTDDPQGDGSVHNPAEIDEFDSSGIFVRRLTAASSGLPTTLGPNLGGVAVDPTNGDILVTDRTHSVVDEFSPAGDYIGQFDGSDTPAGQFGTACAGFYPPICSTDIVGLDVNSQGYLYVDDGYNHVVDIYGPRAVRPTIVYKPETNPTATSVTLNATVDPHGTPDISSCHFDYAANADYNSDNANPYGSGASHGTATCVPDPSGGNFTSPTDVHVDLSSLTAETKYHYRVVIGNSDGNVIGPDRTYSPHKVIGLSTGSATGITADGATLNGSFIHDGTATHYYFDWGPTSNYGHQTAPPPGDDADSPGVGVTTPVSSSLTDLQPATIYHYRVVAVNGSGISQGDDRIFKTAPLAPEVQESVSLVHSNGALFHAEINPGGADTSYHFEYGTSPCSDIPNPCESAPTPEAHVGSNQVFDSASRIIEGLDPNTVYYYRVVATNEVDTVPGPDHTFATQPFNASLSDLCSNKLARQQTGAALVLDCRAYELVSVAHAGGYDVESDLVPGQTPSGGYPRAQDMVLYGLHNGAIPGVSGNPTNHGVDPYIATRGAEGWSTSYVGIPADAPDGPLVSPPFSSTPSGADQSLDTFAFGGPNLCDPCFGDGSQGIPLHNPDGTLSQGMLGSENVANPVSAGTVKKPLSDDGSHFLFGSEQEIQLGGNDSSGDVTIYSRDLKSVTTEVVSTDTGGTALADGDNVVELDVSDNGSRTLIGDLVDTDTAGNHYYDLYMHVAGDPDSIHLTPNVPDGALYDGMTSDGTKVFFTTKDVPTGTTDGDTSADIFKADVGSSSASLSRVSTGSPGGDTDLCTPSAGGWNSVGGGNSCDAVAIGGGGGVASGDGTFYFLSPEKLDGASNGADGQANLYVVRPGSAPLFVATIDTTVGKPPLPVAFSRTFGSFSNAEALTVDQSTGNPTSGDVYVLNPASGTVSRFKPDGTPDDFTCGTCSGNTLPAPFGSFFFDGPSAAEIAIDNSPGPSNGNIYVVSFPGVDVFDSTGEYLTTLNGGGNPNGYYSESCGVAVDQANGNVYVGDYGGYVWRYTPTSGTVSESNYSGGITTPNATCEVAADTGNVYAGDTYSNADLLQFRASNFTTDLTPPSPTPVPVTSSANAVTVNPANGDVYATDGNTIHQFDSSANPIKTFDSANLTPFTAGVAVYGATGAVYASVGNHSGADHIAVFESPPPKLDNPMVLDGVSDANSRHTADFQATPDGAFAAFSSSQALLPSVDNAGHMEIYRYDASAPALDCVSCNPTHAQSAGDASMASDGLSLTDDGRVFFDSNDALALGDGNNRKDAYEWETPGTGSCAADPQNPNYFAFTGDCMSLISSGSSPFDSSLLSAGADGTDAYFFTHDTLAHEDENGPVTKLYDARVDGGFFNVPPPALCVASDECHGPGTKASPSPDFGTVGPSPGNAPNCRKGFVQRHGVCVRRKGTRRHRHHRRHHNSTHRRHG
jgi:hypothetical protein